MANTQFQPVDVPRRSLGEVLGSYRRGAGEGFRSHYTPSGIRENYANNGAFRGSMTTAQDLTGGLGRLFHNLLSGGSNRNRIDRLDGANSVGLNDWNSRAGNDISNTTASDAMNRLLGRGFTPGMFSGVGASSQGGLRGNSPSYMGFGSGTGAFPYHGNAAATSGGDIYNSALAPSQQFVDNREHSNTAQGMEGITSPNTRGLSANAAALASYGPGYIYLYIKPPNNAANISGGGARDNFAGGGQSSARGGSSDWSNTFASLGMLGSQGGGLDPQSNRNVGHDRLRKTLRNRLKENPNDQKALAWLAQMHENAQAGK